LIFLNKQDANQIEHNFNRSPAISTLLDIWASANSMAYPVHSPHGCEPFGRFKTLHVHYRPNELILHKLAFLFA
jgi:hypothetical protein